MFLDPFFKAGRAVARSRKLPKRAEPLPPFPEDIAVRRPRTVVEQESPRPHVFPYEVEDPVTGVKTQKSAMLHRPFDFQQDDLLTFAAADTDLAFGLVRNALKNVDSEQALYPILIQIRNLRTWLKGNAGTAYRRTVGSSSETKSGSVSRSVDLPDSDVGRLSDIATDRLDAAIWEAAERIGIPFEMLQKAFAIPVISKRAAKAEDSADVYLKLYGGIGQKVSKAGNNTDELKNVRKVLSGYLQDTGPVIKAAQRGELTPLEQERILKQASYYLSQVNAKLGLVGDEGSLPGLLKALNNNLPEDVIHSRFLEVIRNTGNLEDVRSLTPLARNSLKSETFIDDIDRAVGERLLQIITQQKENVRAFDVTGDAYLPVTIRPARPPQIPAANAERYQQAMGMSPFGTVGPLGGMNKFFEQSFGLSEFANFGRGKNRMRSFERYNPETKKYDHYLYKINADETYELVAINPPGLRARGVAVREFEAPRVEFQGFSSRVAVPFDDGAIESARLKARTPSERLKDAYPNAKELITLIERLDAEGVIVPGTPQYSWAWNVLPKIYESVIGPGAYVTKKGNVTRDRNSGRRVAALLALDKADQAALVPTEALEFILKIAPDAKAYDELMATRPVKQARKSKKVKDAPPTVLSEQAAIRKLILDSEADAAKISKLAKRET